MWDFFELFGGGFDNRKGVAEGCLGDVMCAVGLFIFGYGGVGSLILASGHTKC